MKKFRDFESAREFVRSLGIQTWKKWQEYSKSGNKPDDIPAYPNEKYKKEWKGMPDFLGNGNIANQNRAFKSFESARTFVQLLKLKNQREWNTYSKSDDRPIDIPANPPRAYKRQWIDWGDWLGTYSIAPQNIVYQTFDNAKKFVQSLKLKSKTEWEKYCKSGKKPKDIPMDPRQVYKKDWKGWGDWLSTGRIANQNRAYRSYNDAREFVQKLGLKNYREWKEYCKSGKKPNDIPSEPWLAYK